MMRWSLLVGVLLIRVGVAGAETGIVVVHGTAEPHVREAVATAIEGSLRTASWSVAPGPSESGTIIACASGERPWSCIAPIVAKGKIDHVVVADVAFDKADGGQIVITEQIIASGDAVPPIDHRFCANCNDAKLSAAAAELTTSLLARTPSAPQTGQSGAIVTHSPPQGATIKPVDHVVQTGVPRVVSGLVLGVGAAALIGGSLISYEQADPPLIGPHSKYVYSGPALVVAGVGAIAVGVGVYLWLAHPPHTTSATSAPTVSLSPSGGFVGWISSF